MNVADLGNFLFARTPRIHCSGKSHHGWRGIFNNWKLNRCIKLAYGSKRLKWTKLVANFPLIQRINKTCPGDHVHEAWGVQRQGARRIFATSLEVHYPSLLCDEVADTIALALRERNIFPEPTLSLNQTARALSHVQAGTVKIPTYLPEYKCKVVTVWHNDLQIWPQQLLDLSLSKLLHEIQLGGEDMQHLCSGLQQQRQLKNLDICFNASDFANFIHDLVFPCVVHLKIFGMYWTELEVEKTMQAKHPLDASLAVPEQLRESVSYNLHTSEQDITLHRARYLAKWLKRAKELSADGRELKASMNPEVSAAVAGMRILVFEEPDMSVVDELKLGASLTGNMPPTNMLPGKFSPALATVEELQANAARIRPKLDHECMGSGDDHIVQVVWSKTLQEVERGWSVAAMRCSRHPTNFT